MTLARPELVLPSTLQSHLPPCGHTPDKTVLLTHEQDLRIVLFPLLLTIVSESLVPRNGHGVKLKAVLLTPCVGHALPEILGDLGDASGRLDVTETIDLELKDFHESNQQHRLLVLL